MKPIQRRTKILATLGPATEAPASLRRLLTAGVDVVRLNFSHGTPAEHAQRAAAVRQQARELKRDTGILVDLQGPKIRIESFVEGHVDLEEGQTFALDTALDPSAGNAREVGCSYLNLPKDLKTGDTVLLNDGAIALDVKAVSSSRIETVVLVGGRLSNRKGINRKGGGLSAPALSDKDRADIGHAVKLGADFIAVSFPREAADMIEARRLVKEAGGHARLVAKIERAEALDNLESLIDASDVVMVARGDLGVEIGDAELPGWQKRIIELSRQRNRLVITATQMMESMINSPIPTRAEVLDVANAVMDGTDAVMLSAETATGKYPVKVIEAVNRVCLGAEKNMHFKDVKHRMRPGSHFERTDEAIAMATTWTADQMHAQAIISLTESGSTALMMSRNDSDIPIFALTQHENTRRRMSLCRGVYPIDFEPSRLDNLAPMREAVACLQDREEIEEGDRVLLTKGDFTGPGGTNAMKIITVGARIGGEKKA